MKNIWLRVCYINIINGSIEKEMSHFFGEIELNFQEIKW